LGLQFFDDALGENERREREPPIEEVINLFRVATGVTAAASSVRPEKLCR
jgi:hypothetical protein